MTGQYAKGSMNKVEGRVEEGIGKLSGDRREQVKGKGKQVQGDIRQRLASIQDAARRP